MTDNHLPPSSSGPEDLSDARLEALLAGHALGDLEEHECLQLQRALAADPSLAARLEEFRTTLGLLPLALADAQAPPPRLRRRLLGGATPRRPPPPRRSWIVAGLLGLALLVVGGDWLRARRQLAERESHTEVLRTLALHGVGAAGDGDAGGRVLVSRAGDHNLLELHDLPAPPAQHSYRLWARVDGRMVGCVRFLPDDSGTVRMPIPTNPSSLATAVSVTVEPIRPGREAPEGPAVLTSL
jgi:hypothetical protein